MCQSEGMPELMERFNEKAVLRKGRFSGEAVELLPEPGGGNHGHCSAQLGLSEDKGHHGNEEIHVGDPEKAAIRFMRHVEQGAQEHLGTVLPPCRIVRFLRQGKRPGGSDLEKQFALQRRCNVFKAWSPRCSKHNARDGIHACGSFAPTSDPLSQGNVTTKRVPFPGSVST